MNNKIQIQKKMRTKIKNPVTGRMVYKYGSVGRRVIKDYYVVSLNSGRLIRRDGITFRNQTKEIEALIVKQKKIIKKEKKKLKKQKKIIKKLNKKPTPKIKTKLWIVRTNSMITYVTTVDKKQETHTTISTINHKICQNTKPTKQQIIDKNKKYWDNRLHATLINYISHDMIENKLNIKELIKKGKKLAEIKKLNKKIFINNGKLNLYGSHEHYPWSKNYDEKRGDTRACVIDYLKYELQTMKYIRKMHISTKSLMKSFGMSTLTDGVEYSRIINFVHGCAPYLSLYILSPDGRLMDKIKAKDSRKSLVFVMNNNHIYPILNSAQKESICKKERFDLMDYEFTINYDNHEYIDDDEKLFTTNNKVKLISSVYDFNGVLMKVQKKTKIITTNYKYSGGCLSAFENDGIVYAKTMAYDNRKTLLNNLHIKYNNDMFKFENQSYTRIGIDLYNYHFGHTNDMLSNLSNEQYQLFTDYSLSAYLTTVSLQTQEGQASYTIDVNKSYFDVIINNKHDYNVFTSFDNVQKYDNRDIVNGEFYINRQFEIIRDSKIIMQNGYYPHNFVIYCLENGSITKQDIKYMMLPSFKVDHSKFANFAKYCMDNFEESDVKSIVNHFIGSSGTKYYNKDMGINTGSKDIALYLLNKYELEGHDVVLDMNEDMSLFLLRCRRRTPKLNTSLPVHRSIIAGGIINLCELYKKVKTPKCHIVSYNVDSISVHYGREDIKNVEKIIDGAVDKEDDSYNWKTAIGGYKIEDEYKVRGKMIVYTPNKAYNFVKAKKNKYLTREHIPILHEKNESYCITGPPGVGKTYEMLKLITDKDIMVSHTNKAISNVRSNIKNAKTIDSLFHECNVDNIEDLLKRVKSYDKIYVDEYSMCSPKQMGIFYRLYENGKKIIFIGDSNQCLSISDKQYIYTDVELFKKMINNNIVELEYVPKKCRLDPKLITVINHFKKTGRLHESLKDKELDEDAMCYVTKYTLCDYKLNSKKINNSLVSIIIEEGKGMDIINRGNKQYFKGCKLVGINNVKTLKIWNSELYVIQKIDDNKCVLKSETGNIINVSTKILNSNFDYGYALSVYKYQGSSINEKYNIVNTEDMNKRELYTAMSRATNFDNLNIEYTDRLFVDDELNNDASVKNSIAIKNRKIIKKKKVIKKKEKPSYKIEPVKEIKYQFKIYDCKSECKLKCKYEGYVKKFSYKRCGIEEATRKANEWKSTLFVN